MPMLAGPELVAVNVAPASAVLILDAEPVSWMPAVFESASVRLRRLPLEVVSVTVRLAESTSATVKSASAAAVPAITFWAEVGMPLRVGAKF